jgi:hypothetical protein
MTTCISISQDEAHTIINKFVSEMDSIINAEKSEGSNRIEQVLSIIDNLSMEHAFIRLWLDYDYQVCNGGHMQYADNGYHSTMQHGCMGYTSDEDDIHQELVKLAGLFLTKYPIPLAENFLSTLTDFKIELDLEEVTEDCCSDCGGSGTTSEWVESEEDDEDGEDADIDCVNCEGTGEVENNNEFFQSPDYKTRNLFDTLDTRYYDINNELSIQIATALKV